MVRIHGADCDGGILLTEPTEPLVIRTISEMVARGKSGDKTPGFDRA
jgi:hypothetical protein